MSYIQLQLSNYNNTGKAKVQTSTCTRLISLLKLNFKGGGSVLHFHI